jgi:ABC-type hemin transport system substrate-binding protein
MAPEDSQRLQVCVQEIAAILHKNTPAEKLATLEATEKEVYQHMHEHASPEVALFLLQRQS